MDQRATPVWFFFFPLCVLVDHTYSKANTGNVASVQEAGNLRVNKGYVLLQCPGTLL
jgi:hypothetical protein